MDLDSKPTNRLNNDNRSRTASGCAHNCAKLVDDDEVRFTVAELRRLKSDAEWRARQELALPPERIIADEWQTLQMSKMVT